MEDWIEIAIDTAAEAMEVLSGVLDGLGISSFVIEDETDLRTFLETTKWDAVDADLLESHRGVSRIKLYVPDTDEGRRQMQELSGVLKVLPEQIPDIDFGPLHLSWRETKNEDWENNWKVYYHPFPVGEGLYIVPAWETQVQPPDGRVSIVLNPGLSFGTGSHATTQLCLLALEQYLGKGDRVLDLGCGSGILAIGALKLGAAFAAGVDIDPKAVEVARENAALNQLTQAACALQSGDVLTDERLQHVLGETKHQVVLSNIVADVIIALAPLAEKFLAPGGVWICSGIIVERLQEVKKALVEHGFLLDGAWQQDGWFCCAVKRRRNR